MITLLLPGKASRCSTTHPRPVGPLCTASSTLCWARSGRSSVRTSWPPPRSAPFQPGGVQRNSTTTGVKQALRAHPARGCGRCMHVQSSGCGHARLPSIAMPEPMDVAAAAAAAAVSRASGWTRVTARLQLLQARRQQTCRASVCRWNGCRPPSQSSRASSDGSEQPLCTRPYPCLTLRVLVLLVLQPRSKLLGIAPCPKSFDAFWPVHM